MLTARESREQFEKFGPVYPKQLGGVERHRRLAKTPAGQTWEAKKAYGRAVLVAINALNKPKHVEPAMKAQCASGTFHSDGGAILRAVNAQNFARAARQPVRTHAELASAYETAMAAKAQA